MSAAPKKYTAKQVQKYRDRLFREHQKELNEVRDKYYALGRSNARAELQREIRTLLGITEAPLSTDRVNALVVGEDS